MLKVKKKIGGGNIKRILYFFIGIFILISINTISSAKYIIENTIDVANMNIDRTKPKIELIEIQNTNTNYPKYANKTHTISFKIKVTEKNIKENNFVKDFFGFKLYENNINIAEDNFSIKEIESTNEGKIYKIDIKGIIGNGKLSMQIKEGAIIDKGGLKSESQNIQTGITIDNTAPVGKFKEVKIQDGKVNGEIILSENIRKIDGWSFKDNNLKITKEFTNNISYQLPITDYAGNTSNVDINITQATYINVVYASHNSCIGWSFGYGNYDVAGKDAIKVNPVYRTEALAFNISGNVDKDFVQANTYIYTYWGEGSKGKCTTSGLIYNYGYNPGKNAFKSMNSNDLITINSKKYFQFGGSGINGYLNTDANSQNPIPGEVANKYKYGISGITMKLKDYSQYSIIYQILVNGAGWVKTASDGSECTYNHNTPMSAFRIALVPKTEKQYVINQWNKDVGTFNMK